MLTESMTLRWMPFKQRGILHYDAYRIRFPLTFDEYLPMDGEHQLASGWSTIGVVIRQC